MKRLFVVLLMLGLSVNLMAQNKPVKQKGDSTVYFYGTMKLSSGMHVMTKIDSISTESEKVEQLLLTINESNKARVLGFARTELGNNRLSANINKKTNILEVKPTLRELKAAMDEFLRVNDGKVYTLMQFMFNKPGQNEKIRVQRYEE
ncbi:hypothetical protein [Roseivirga sp.]|uniref:hypothetical protein n=1 Tax=Roseivirga sp. TaxID=1964215 RepID=UPI003B526345